MFKKLTKMFTLCVLSLVLAIGCFSFTACKDGTSTTAEQQIVTLSVNPEVEFIVDGQEVVSVTASNEDGIYLLEKFSEFTGLTIEEATVKFLELCEEYGFIISGSAEDQTLTISVSGEDAEKLFNDIKTATDKKVKDLGVKVGDMVKIGKEKLKDMVEECYQELSQEDVEKLSEKQLVEKIKKSREDTKHLHTKEEKNQFYFDRAYTILQGKVDKIKEVISLDETLVQNQIITQLITTLDSACLEIKTSYDTIKAQMQEDLALIDTQMQEYITAKEAYLSAFKAYKDAQKANAENVDALLQEAKTLKATADGIMAEIELQRDTLKAQTKLSVDTLIETAMVQINTIIDSILEAADITIDNIQTDLNQKVEDLKDSYKDKTKNPWQKPQGEQSQNSQQVSQVA